MMGTMTASTLSFWKEKRTPRWTLVRAERDPEERIRQRVLAGDTDAFLELIQPYQRSVYQAAFGIVGDSADAEEVAQEAFLKALKHLGRFRAECKFSTWLIQIALNEARMKVRNSHRHLYESMDKGYTDEDGDYVPRDFADWREIPSQALERQQLREALQRAIASLPEKYRSVLILRDVQKLSTSEAARLLGITESSAKTRLSRARLRMRDALIEMGAAKES